MNTSLKNKNILITGGEGFVGAHLVKSLQDVGANVWSTSKRNNIPPYVKVNILSLLQLDRFIKEKKIAICFHLAGVSLVEAGQKDPYKTFKTNITGTLNILEAARVNKLEKIIIASTSHVYGDSMPPFKETDSARPSRPYETSKTASDLLAQSYADTFQLPVIIARFVNIYGPGDFHKTRLIPKVVQAVLKNEEVGFWGGNVIREYLYIDDAINAYLKIASAGIPIDEKNRIFNFGSKQKASVSEIIKKIISLSHKKTVKIKRIPNLRQSEIGSQFVLSTKAKKIFGWESTVSLDEGLMKTINWYRENFK